MNSKGCQAFWELIYYLSNKNDLSNKNNKVENLQKIFQQGPLNYLLTWKVHTEGFRIDKFWMPRILIIHIYEKKTKKKRKK